MGANVSHLWQDAQDYYQVAANSSRIAILTPEPQKSKQRGGWGRKKEPKEGQNDQLLTPSGDTTPVHGTSLYAADDPRSPARKDASFDRTPVILENEEAEKQLLKDLKDQQDLRKRLFRENIERNLDQQLQEQQH